ncbi:hypothetical protein BHM03_00006965 [Ensete ventricosum]|nr:hypothetical protein BHM03_00006965 [Ensete ventricosum]
MQTKLPTFPIIHSDFVLAAAAATATLRKKTDKASSDHFLLSITTRDDETSNLPRARLGFVLIRCFAHLRSWKAASVQLSASQIPVKWKVPSRHHNMAFPTCTNPVVVSGSHHLMRPGMFLGSLLPSPRPRHRSKSPWFRSPRGYTERILFWSAEAS